MNERNVDKIIQTFCERKRDARNAELKESLANGGDFETLLGELASLRGLNVEEREIVWG